MQPGANDQITPFNFNGNNVRTIADDQGEPWFVLKDVCDVLEITNPRNAAARIASSDKGVRAMDTPGGTQNITIVNESGLYDVILDSRKPQAREFRRWVTAEVIPSIRKHGGYLTERKIEEVLADPDTIINLATELKQARAVAAKESERANQLNDWKRATEAGDGLKLSDFRAKYFTSVPHKQFFQHLYDTKYIRDERGIRIGRDGRKRDGRNHMQPLRKANRFLYRHEEGTYGGKKRLRTRVKPATELEFRDRLISEGLEVNTHSTGLVLVAGVGLPETETA